MYVLVKEKNKNFVCASLSTEGMHYYPDHIYHTLQGRSCLASRLETYLEEISSNIGWAFASLDSIDRENLCKGEPAELSAVDVFSVIVATRLSSNFDISVNDVMWMLERSKIPAVIEAANLTRNLVDVYLDSLGINIKCEHNISTAIFLGSCLRSLVFPRKSQNSRIKLDNIFASLSVIDSSPILFSRNTSFNSSKIRVLPCSFLYERILHRKEKHIVELKKHISKILSSTK